MTKQWFYRMLLSYVPIFLILTSVLLLIALYGFNDTSKNEAERASRVYASQVLNLVDLSLKSVDQSMVQAIVREGGIRQYYEDFPLDVYENYEVSQSVVNFTINTPLVDSMYLYRYRDDAIISTGIQTSLSDYADRDFLMKAITGDNGYRWSGKRSFNEFPAVDPGRSVVTLVKRVEDLGFMVVNVNLGKLEDQIKSYFESAKNVNEIHLLDGSENPLFGDPGSSSSVVKLSSDYSGWVISYGLKDTKLFEFVSSFSLVWFVLYLAIVIAGLLGIIFVTKHNYKPIEGIIGRINRYSSKLKSGISGEKEISEFQFIDTALERLIDQSNLYQKGYEESLLFKRQNLLQELFEGTRISKAEEWEAEWSHLGLSLTVDHQIVVAIVEIDHYAQFSGSYSQRDQNLFKFVIYNVIKEIGDKHKVAVWAEWIEPHQLGMLCMIEGTDDRARAAIVEVGKEVSAWIQEHLQFTISIGIGRPVIDYQEIPAAYDMASEAIKYKLVKGTNQLVLHWDVPVGERARLLEYLQLIRSAVQTYRTGQTGWEQSYNELFEQLKLSGLSRDDIIGLINYLLFHFHRNMMEMSKEIKELWLNVAEARLESITYKYDSLDELKPAIHEVLLDAFEQIEVIREKKGNKTVTQNIKQYIETHYADPNLSLNHLSDHFSYHSTYLSKLFKDEFGDKFVDYVATVRVEQAKSLLLNTELTIQEIAERVGYLHSFSFSRVFKKLVGMPPGEYRKHTEG
jgi:AraC-like DNA-binding protein